MIGCSPKSISLIDGGNKMLLEALGEYLWILYNQSEEEIHEKEKHNMRLNKKVFSTISVSAIAFIFCLSAKADDVRTSGLYTYNIKGNGTLTITGFDWTNNDGNVFIPSMIDGYTVTTIGENAFSPTTNLTTDSVSVTLPDNITMIGQGAFNYSPIFIINIPTSIKDIGIPAFIGCENLTQFIVDPANEKYASIKGALYEKPSKKLLCWPLANDEIKDAVPEGILEIGDYAFADLPHWYDLDEIIPSTIEKIGIGAFKGSVISIEEGSLPKSITVIPEYAFFDTGRISGTIENVVSIGDYAFAFTEWVGPGHFWTLSDQSPLLPCVEEIGNYAFYNRVFITNWNKGSVLVFPNTLHTIGDYAFAAEKATKVETANGKLQDYIEISLPASLQSMGIGAFSNRIDLQKITIDEGYQANISDEMFMNCKKLTTINLPESISSIGKAAFSGCEALSEIKIPKNVSVIGDDAFERKYITLFVEKGSYAEIWAQENGYNYKYEDQNNVDDLDWLNGDNSNSETEDTSWVNN